MAFQYSSALSDYTMASSFPSTPFFSLILFSLLFLSPSQAKTSSYPHALILTVKKDPTTLMYTTQINQRTPPVLENLTLDLGGEFLWEDCKKYKSKTYRRARCGGDKCEFFRGAAKSGRLGADVVRINSTDGSTVGKEYRMPDFLFVCGKKSFFEGLPSSVRGMAGLGHSEISLPSQISSYFHFNNTFAICLSGSTSASGVVIFGPGPYKFLPNTDASTNLIYTPLLLKPIKKSEYSNPANSPDYFIGVTSIKINNITVPNIDASMLAMDHEGNGGTKICTVSTPYTVLKTSIYKAVTKFFKKQLSGVPTVKAVAPFGLCFDSTKIGSTRVGPAVPPIDLVLQNETVFWRIFGANSMKQVSDNVLCLAFVDGGVKMKVSILIGGYQLEDNLLQFDLCESRLGFSSSLLFRETTCANFNLTSTA